MPIDELLDASRSASATNSLALRLPLASFRAAQTPE
jgi:hypothetical protein